MSENKGKDEFLRILGKNIREKREEKEISQELLGTKCGYKPKNARSAISKIETGINDVPASKLKEIADTLGISVSELIKDTEQVQKKMLVCNLLEQCYGSKAFELVELFVKLNDTGKAKALEDLADLVQLPKYTEEEKRASARMA